MRCPLPEPGQAPTCLVPALQEYDEFFSGVRDGSLPSEVSERVEADLSGGAGIERAYLALSSVGHAYFRLAAQIGVRPDADPVLLARLAHWNELIVGLYGRSNLDPSFRLAIRDMARDLHRHLARQSVAIHASCATDDLLHCGQSADLVRAMASLDHHTGVRSPLAQILQHLVGLEPDALDSAEGGILK